VLILHGHLKNGNLMFDSLTRWAAEQPDSTAVRLVDVDANEVVKAPDRTLSFAQLHSTSSRVAQWLISIGMPPGSGFALLMENSVHQFEFGWGARRAGLYYTPISIHLKPAEVAYVLKDCGARLLVITPGMAELAEQVMALLQADAAALPTCCVVGGSHKDLVQVDLALPQFSSQTALAERPVGRDFLYSSGTTGFPKGVKRPLQSFADRFTETQEFKVWREFFHFTRDTRYLSPAPLYHAAPLRYSMRVIEVGGTCVVMNHFKAERALGLIDQYRITHSQWVPTMLIRMLDLPAEVKQRYDLSSMQVAIHAASPCPPDVKRAVIDWWGPVLYEYYGGSEGVGLTALTAAEWLSHPGSVGRAVYGVAHIKDDEGIQLAAGEQGKVWFSGAPRFEYHGDPVKTAQAYDADGHGTYGDIGHLDDDGYLYLSGRRTDLILSGGVNIYPQEIENLLATYPGVADVAVIGVPHPEFGEAVKAVIELKNWVDANDAFAEKLMAYCREHLARLKCPRSVDFRESLPRQANGKLYKRHLMNEYAQAPTVKY
jgi:long-chain acyl-CoA synthetase